MNRKARRRAAKGVIPPEVLQSTAYRSLSENARKVLAALARQYDGHNNGLLTFDARDSAAVDIAHTETQLALFELEAAGLVNSRLAGGRQ